MVAGQGTQGTLPLKAVQASRRSDASNTEGHVAAVG